MLWIGLTGGIACGKTLVAQMLRASGCPVVDADVIAREVVAQGTEAHAKIASLFGADAISENGELDRAKVGAAVFCDRNRMHQLEAIIHPLVRRRTEILKNELEKNGAPIAFYDVPLLFEKKMEPFFDKILVVSCRPEVQLERLMMRNQMSKVDAEKRIASQLSLSEKEAGADFLIENNGDSIALELAVGKALKALLNRR